MSSFLANIHRGATTTGIRAVISGVEKIGKTTLACSAPSALLVPLEQGYASMAIDKVPQLAQYEEVSSLLDEIGTLVAKGTFEYKSIIFDSATALERLIHDQVLRRDSAYVKDNAKALTMETALGGYGRSYQYANELFGDFLNKCDYFSLNQVNVIITSHVFASKVIDPTVGEYDTWDLLLHSPKNSKSYGKREMLTQWADLIGFLHEPIYISEGKALNKAISANKGRILGVSRTPAYVAGNRYNIVGEISIPQQDSWNYLAHSIYTSSGLDFYNRPKI